jgi:hypothetical protein
MNTTLPHVAICVPSGDMVHADFALSLAGLCNSVGTMGLEVISNKSSIVAIARNNGVAMAREAGADYLLFLDSDMVFPRSTLLRLLLHGKDIVGATYAKRVPPYSPLGEMLADGPVGDDAGLVEMARLPTGCILLRTAVFDSLSRPYFHFGVEQETGNIVGEDYVFCDRVRQAGHRIWCDMRLSREIGHIGQHVFRLPPDK